MKSRKTISPQSCITISAKNLGALALPDCCPRCFWLKLKVGHRLPFSFFPGIFASIDAYTKKVVDNYFAANGAPPPWLAELGDIVESVEPPHWKHFDLRVERYDIVVRGVSDAIFVRRGRKLVIVDYKTARFTDAQDDLLPMYAVQLNVYGMIAEALGMGSVDGLALVYLEPETDDVAARRGCGVQGLKLGFTARVVPVAINLGGVDVLLEKTRHLFDMASPPPSTAGCQNCERLTALTKCLRPPSKRGTARVTVTPKIEVMPFLGPFEGPLA